MILRVTVRGPRDIEFDIEPVMINNAQPTPLDGEQASRALARIRALGARIGAASEAEYQGELASNFRRFRREVYFHYLPQFWRSNPRHFAANIAEIIRRRV